MLITAMQKAEGTGGGPSLYQGILWQARGHQIWRGRHADCDLKNKVMQDIVLMKYVGMQPIVVHGGGPEINRMLERLNIRSEFVNGLRVSDRKTMEVVEMVLGGKVNKGNRSGINASGGRAIGISGKDDNLIEAQPLDPSGRMGYVGEIKRINPQLIETYD